MRTRVFLALSLLVVALTACEGPTAGELSVELITPSTNDGAILFKLRTPSPREFGSISATCTDCQAFAYQVSASEIYCVVTGELSSGPLARIVVSDVNPRSVYEARVLEVSGVDRRLRSNVGYELRLSH